MGTETIALLSPGDMGHTVAQVLVSHGLRVITCLRDRTEQTRLRSRRAGIEEVPSYRDLVSEANLFLSIVPPAEAVQTAQAVSRVISETQKRILYADCNAISPETVTRIEGLITDAGGRFVDVSIIGPPPVKQGTTRFYVSGADRGVIQGLVQYGLTIIPLGDRAGQASAFKMCYAALTKGATALATELLIASQVFNFFPALKEEFRSSEPVIYDSLERKILAMPKKSKRFVGEMEEIAKTFENVGLTPMILQGAADLYRFVAGTALAQGSTDPPAASDIDQVLTVLADSLKNSKG
jgi:3-hydroxyisobutyrate dehydrogenase-like beta-hydroxyacid dehydrogenase